MSKASRFIENNLNIIVPAAVLGTIGLAALAHHLYKPKPAPALPGDPRDDPQVQATGWGVNDLCTNADMLDPAIALAHAEAWRKGRRLPPVPVPSAGQAAAFATSLQRELDRYFSETFGCARTPDGLFVGDDVWTPADAAAAVAERINNGLPIIDPMGSFIMATAGLGEFA